MDSDESAVVQVRLSPFERAHAALVVSWVRDADELKFVSPETQPPLTVEKVMAWGAPAQRQYVLIAAGETEPLGYAELNDMPNRPQQKWIGHLLLDPARRGMGLGRACVATLLAEAFGRLNAEAVVLVVSPSNERAVTCYRSAGMVPLGDEWKRAPWSTTAHRLLRMGIDRRGYQHTQNNQSREA
ncbi:MAG: GNAT family N-acetyltransferase [Phycisphaerae bacterium]|nr:GNAT family N-acetyltransferase [Phycisphaerae bacterium]NUQ46938.1 GNAT family N-acetyltransferase [Phycisphaerae bacterium]